MINKKLSVLTLALALAGCGSGDSDEKASTPAPAPQPIFSSYDLTAIDGYLKNADIWLDINGNGLLDSGEPSTTTGDGGRATLQIPSDITAEDYSVVVIAKAGITIDESFGRTIVSDFIMAAPPGEPVVTPLSTLVYLKMKSDATKEEAIQQVAETLNIPTYAVLGDFIAQEETSAEIAAVNIVSSEVIPSDTTELAIVVADPTELNHEIEQLTEILVDLEEGELIVRDEIGTLVARPDSDNDGIADVIEPTPDVTVDETISIMEQVDMESDGTIEAVNTTIESYDKKGLLISRQIDQEWGYSVPVENTETNTYLYNADGKRTHSTTTRVYKSTGCLKKSIVVDYNEYGDRIYADQESDWDNDCVIDSKESIKYLNKYNFDNSGRVIYFERQAFTNGHLDPYSYMWKKSTYDTLGRLSYSESDSPNYSTQHYKRTYTYVSSTTDLSRIQANAFSGDQIHSEGIYVYKYIQGVLDTSTYTLDTSGNGMPSKVAISYYNSDGKVKKVTNQTDYDQDQVMTEEKTSYFTYY